MNKLIKYTSITLIIILLNITLLYFADRQLKSNYTKSWSYTISKYQRIIDLQNNALSLCKDNLGASLKNDLQTIEANNSKLDSITKEMNTIR